MPESLTRQVIEKLEDMKNDREAILYILKTTIARKTKLRIIEDIIIARKLDHEKTPVTIEL